MERGKKCRPMTQSLELTLELGSVLSVEDMRVKQSGLMKYSSRLEVHLWSEK